MTQSVNMEVKNQGTLTDMALGDDFIEFVVEHDQGYWICLSTEPNLQEPDSNLHAFRKLDCWLN